MDVEGLDFIAHERVKAESKCEAVAVIPQIDFSDIRFSRSATGHIHSAWWSYDHKKFNPHGPYQIGSHFHWLREQSMEAFAYALGIRKDDVLVSVRENPVDGATEWRCGTIRPCAPPKPKLTQGRRLLEIEKLVQQVESPGAPQPPPALTCEPVTLELISRTSRS